MTFEYSVIPIIVGGVLIVGAMEIIPLLRQGQYREIIMVCVLLILGMAVLVSRILGVRLPPVSAMISDGVKHLLGG